MKKIVFALIAAASIQASAEYVTVEVCDRGDAGNYCQLVTYKVRPASPATPVAETCPRGDNDNHACPTEYGVPSWVSDLNQWFEDQGATPADPIDAGSF